MKQICNSEEFHDNHIGESDKFSYYISKILANCVYTTPAKTWENWVVYKE